MRRLVSVLVSTLLFGVFGASSFPALAIGQGAMKPIALSAKEGSVCKKVGEKRDGLKCSKVRGKLRWTPDWANKNVYRACPDLNSDFPGGVTPTDAVAKGVNFYRDGIRVPEVLPRVYSLNKMRLDPTGSGIMCPKRNVTRFEDELERNRWLVTQYRQAFIDESLSLKRAKIIYDFKNLMVIVEVGSGNRVAQDRCLYWNEGGLFNPYVDQIVQFSSTFGAPTAEDVVWLRQNLNPWMQSYCRSKGWAFGGYAPA